MKSDIYLFLLRQEGKFETFKDAYSKGGKAAIGMKLLKWLKGFVMGDSLDAPFIKFIKVGTVSHSISFGSDDKQLKYDNAALQEGEWTELNHSRGEFNSKSHALQNADLVAKDYAADFLRQGGMWKTIDRTRRTASRRSAFDSGNMFLNSHTPSHGALSFSKKIDKATPQLAFGCSAQERFPFGIFFYRRRTGLGIEGSRMPYMVIGVDKVLISSWSLNGDDETVTLKYKRIGWAATDQISDTNVSIPGFTRTWDVESRTGGEGGWALGLQALTLALAGMAGLLAKPFS